MSKIPLQTKAPSHFRAKDVIFDLRSRAYVMGILNVTPDSFSDGGKYFLASDAAAHAQDMVKEGADIIDIGGESTRPGFSPIDEYTEKNRVIPIIEAVRSSISIPISIDTSKAGVARAALAKGAMIVNDIWGLQKDAQMAGVVADAKAGVIIMANYSNPSLLAKSGNIVDDCLRYLEKSLTIASKAGIESDHICVDPGIGFGIDTEESVALLRAIPEIKKLGYPVLIGASKKRFIGELMGNCPVEERAGGTLAVSCASVGLGARFVRVHDVKETVNAMKIITHVGGIYHG